MKGIEHWKRRITGALRAENPLQALNRLRREAGGPRHGDRLTDVMLALQDVFEEALAVGDRVGVAATLQLQASCLEDMDEEERAAAALDEALNFCPADQIGLRMAVEHHLGQINLRLKRPALEHLSRALELAQMVGDMEWQYLVLQSLAEAHVERLEYSLARSRLRDALSLSEQTENRLWQMQVLDRLGAIGTAEGDFDSAAGWLVGALELSRELEDRQDEGAVLCELGHVRLNQRREGEAMACFARAVSIFEELGDLEGQAVALHEMGRMCRMTGQWAEAVERLHEALRGYRSARDPEGETAVLRELARLDGPPSGPP